MGVVGESLMLAYSSISLTRGGLGVGGVFLLADNTHLIMTMSAMIMIKRSTIGTMITMIKYLVERVDVSPDLLSAARAREKTIIMEDKGKESYQPPLVFRGLIIEVCSKNTCYSHEHEMAMLVDKEGVAL